jgi:nitrate/TMAO reductase-like tetraheme cytochrome c subunit
MAFRILDPETKQFEKIIRQEENNRIMDRLLDQLHTMKTPGVTCLCDKCNIVRDLINKVMK